MSVVVPASQRPSVATQAALATMPNVDSHRMPVEPSGPGYYQNDDRWQRRKSQDPEPLYREDVQTPSEGAGTPYHTLPTHQPPPASLNAWTGLRFF